MIAALGTAVPMHIVVVDSDSGSGWLTPVVAVLGLVLALVSLAWQVVAFTRSGSRVRVEAKFGLFLSQLLPGRVPTETSVFLNDEPLAATRNQGYPGVMLMASSEMLAGKLSRCRAACGRQGTRSSGNLRTTPCAACPSRTGSSRMLSASRLLILRQPRQ